MREYGCQTGKIIYRSPQAAYHCLAGIKTGRKARGEGAIYRCPHCGHWHLAGHNRRGKPDGVDHREKNKPRKLLGNDLQRLLGSEDAPPVH